MLLLLLSVLLIAELPATRCVSAADRDSAATSPPLCEDDILSTCDDHSTTLSGDARRNCRCDKLCTLYADCCVDAPQQTQDTHNTLRGRPYRLSVVFL